MRPVSPTSPSVMFLASEPLELDCGQSLGPFTVAYEIVWIDLANRGRAANERTTIDLRRDVAATETLRQQILLAAPYRAGRYRLMIRLRQAGGPDEWSRRGTVARKAAGKVHSDIERGFIRAEIYRPEDLKEAKTEAVLKSQGKMRVEGKEYVMQDGDVVNFRFNV